MSKNYFLGLDIGTDSVGYAVTDRDYSLIKYHGEPMWGVQLFDQARLCDERRAFRTARRRLDRRQQRIDLLRELLASEISKADPGFYNRINCSALYADDKKEPYSLFNDEQYTDKDYHKQYPTIHHLICELMNNHENHDVRLVYLACAWLVSHRGHFLSDISMNNIGDMTDFKQVYDDLTDVLLRRADEEISLPWSLSDINKLGDILKKKQGVTKKSKEIFALLFDSKSPKNVGGFSLNFDVLFKALCGGKITAKDLFMDDEYADIESFSLDSDDEKIAMVMTRLGDDAEVIHVLKEVYDWSLLATVLNGSSGISEAKVKIYEQHKKDLAFLKYFIRKYAKSSYNPLFRASGNDNYVAYSYHTDDPKVKKATKEVFSKNLEKIVKAIIPNAEDKERYDDMIARLETRTFLPKQKDTDNRTIPHQLYQYELELILKNAEKYIPSLTDKDENGLSVSQKIISVFTFRVPYYVGPLNARSPYAWIKRKADGKIYPWNFTDLVDEDESEQEFIRRMTNKCTYVPYADVVPKDSLLYHRFTVLNEINNIRIDDQPLSVEGKQAIYNDLFMQRRKVTFKELKNFLICRNFARKDSVISGIDEQIKSNLKPYHDFARLRASGTLTDAQIEDIILHRTCTDEKLRFTKWLAKTYPILSEADVKYVSSLRYKDFGRLSREFLEGIEGASKTSATGEAFSIIGTLWNTNDNLMQILSGSYTYAQTLADLKKEYYADRSENLIDRLDEMYVSNAVKRPVIRSLDIVQEIVKANGSAPDRIFIEMTRGDKPEQNGKRTQSRRGQNGKRTQSRREQILELYKKCSEQDVRELEKELEDLGEAADMRLRGEKLFLYFMQFGKCAYSGETIKINELATKTYDIDHIYPQAFVKDDSVINNKVLVLSKLNGAKKDVYPISSEIRSKMNATWAHWRDVGTVSEEKFKRLTRSTGFTPEEKLGFINRQLVETSQSTKAVAEILKERYPETEIVYVKARLASEFRQEYDLLKSRTFNDLHHAKDAYLNVVVGNVYYMKFTRRWFDTTQEYSVNTHAVFGTKPWFSGDERYWNGEKSIAKVKETVVKNNAHCTKYAYCRHGGFFNQKPVVKAEGLVPRKAGLPTEKYGGYNGVTASSMILVRYKEGKKWEVLFFPIPVMYDQTIFTQSSSALEYVSNYLQTVSKKIDFQTLSFPLGMRRIKMQSTICADGFKMCVTSGSLKDGRMGLEPIIQFSASYQEEFLLKKIEKLVENCKDNPDYVYSSEYDYVTSEKNIELYKLYMNKLENSVFKKRFGADSLLLFLKEKQTNFKEMSVVDQAKFIFNLHKFFTRESQIDLSLPNGSKTAYTTRASLKLSNWKKAYSDVYIVDSSASGLWEKRSGNLLELL